MKTAYIFLSIKDMRLSLFLTYRRDHFNNNKFLQSMNDQKKNETQKTFIWNESVSHYGIYIKEKINYVNIESSVHETFKFLKLKWCI